MKTFHALSVLTLLSASSAVALAHGGKGRWMDANGDGKVTLAEAQEAAKKHFAKLDDNKDGVLDRAELDGKGSRKFSRADANNDGKITQTEALSGVKDWFTRKDTNKDGVLSGDELPGKHGDKHKRS